MKSGKVIGSKLYDNVDDATAYLVLMKERGYGGRIDVGSIGSRCGFVVTTYPQEVKTV